MSTLSQEALAKSLIQLTNVGHLLCDGCHEKELGKLVEISNALFEELSDNNKVKFKEWLNAKKNEA